MNNSIAKNIGRKFTLKYVLIGLVILIVILILKIIYSDYVTRDWPINIGGKRQVEFIPFGIKVILAHIIGAGLIYFLGGLLGKLTISDKRQTYLLSVLTMFLIFSGAAILLGSVSFAVIYSLLALPLGYFLNKELNSNKEL